MSDRNQAPDPPGTKSSPQLAGHLFELCAGSVDDVRAGAAAGVDRIELNSALPLGGLTPTVASLEAAKEAFPGPVICMVRPREGGFVYTPVEVRLIVREAEQLIQHGADGLVVGFLTPDHRIDTNRCEQFRREFDGIEIVFHRAIDLCDDPVGSARRVADCGFQRILTSGGRTTAVDGAGTLRVMAAAAGPNTQIVAGGGVRAGNVVPLLTESGVRQVHAAVRRTVQSRVSPHTDRTRFAAEGSWYRHGAVCPVELQALMKEIRQLDQVHQ